MAKLTKDNVVKSGMSAFLPRNRYTLRGLEAKGGLSKSSGNPMITFKAEVLCNGDGLTVIESLGEQVDISGKHVTYYIPFTEGSAANVLEFFEKLGHPLEEGFDPEALLAEEEELPDVKFLKGLIFDAVLSSEERIPRMAPAKGEKVGETIKGADGKPLSMGWNVTNQLSDICGLSEIPETLKGGKAERAF